MLHDPRKGDDESGEAAAPAPAPLSLRISLLGGFRVVLGDDAIPASVWRLRKASGLVKLLALAPGHQLHRESIIDLLWPELDPAAGANNLRYALHVARRILETSPARPPRSLHLEGGLLVLRPAGSLWVDSEEFETAVAIGRRTRDLAAYRRAVELYTGDLLPEDRYEDWIAVRREELRGLFIAALFELAHLHQSQGEVELAVEALRRLVGSEPASEEAHVALIRLYAATGRRRLALRQYQQLREALSREVDVEPEPASRKLYEDVLAGRLPPLGAAAAQTTPAVATPSTSAPAPPETPVVRGSLPSMLTSFVGREREIAELERLVSAARLLTLTGTGGCGKTRLALQLASSLADGYADGVCLVELGALTDPTFVPRATAAALDLREASDRGLIETIANYLRRRRLLLVLDNCEHLVEACAALADTLLRTCPWLRVLATSREPLGIPGEIVWRVPSLSHPETIDPNRARFDSGPVDLTRYEAVRLFVERARLVQPSFVLTPDNSAAIARICIQLDGMPLAIELAAARIAVLSPDQIAARLNDRFRLLSAGGRTAPPRHRTLRVAVDWSYELMTPLERTLFNRLALFAGGWALEAAEAVAPDLDDVVQTLSRLVDKSLVLTERTADGAVRYRMLETLRRYGQERLEDSGEAAAAQTRHAEYFLALAEQAESKIRGAEQEGWLARLEQEHDNMRAALAWSLTKASRPELGLRLAGALGWFWYVHGHFEEGISWLQSALDADGPRLDRASGIPNESAAARARALDLAGVLTYQLGDYARATVLLEEALELWQRQSQQRGIARALSNLGIVAQYQGDYGRAAALQEESLALFRDAGDTWDVASVLGSLAFVAQYQGDYERAAALQEESLALYRQVGTSWGVALSLRVLGLVAKQQGDYERAAALLEESLILSRRLGYRRGISWSLQYLGLVAHDRGDGRAAALLEESLGMRTELGDVPGMAECLEGLSIVVAHEQPARAVRLAGAAQALRDRVGAPRPPFWRDEYQRAMTMARRALGEAAFDDAYTSGRAMSAEQVVESGLLSRLDRAALPV